MNEWISVEDRLPGTDGRYLCTHRLFYGHVIVDICYFGLDAAACSDDLQYMGLKGPVWYNTDCECGDFPVGSVTHWMPLPEPPEVGKDVHPE